MSDQIAFYEKRVATLEQENASLKSENKDRRIKAKKAGEEMETLRTQLTTALGERDAIATVRDELTTKLQAAPGELQATIAKLEGDIRSRDHRDAFSAVGEFEVPTGDGKAKKYKLAEGVKLDALWQLAGYKAEGVTPDAATVSAKYGEAMKAHPFLFAEVADAADAAQRPITLQARESGPGGGRGTTSQTTTAAHGSYVAESDRHPMGRL